MNNSDFLSPNDRDIIADLEGFLPDQIFDIHAHLFHPNHFVRENLSPSLRDEPPKDLARYRADMARWLTPRNLDGLFFGYPSRGNDRLSINTWLASDIAGTASKGLALVAPEDSPDIVASQIQTLGLVGLKPYHQYAPFPDTSQAGIEDFAPEWMWEVCHGLKGVLMLHIMKDRAIADCENQAVLRRLCRKYPNCRVVLAHVARSFSYRHARKGLGTLVDLDNVWIDTSAVTETESIRKAIEILGPQRVLFGTDYPISEARGRCVTIENSFFWAHPGKTAEVDAIIPRTKGTLVGLESLLSLKEACEDAGLNAGDVLDIFSRNARRLLAPHLPPEVLPETKNGPQLWSKAWQSISGGTSLLSKRAELHDPQTWPSYFSKCLGSNVWDTSGRRYIDFTGGVGAVLLGYADPDVTKAVKRQLDRGTHCSLCTPDEVELAELLLDLHPWAGRVRYARGGGEALSIAVRIARAATGKSGIAFCGYHGWQDWYLAANLGDDSSLDGHLLPGLQPAGVPCELKGTSVPFRYNDLSSFEKTMQELEGRFAGIVMEPMRSQRPENGFLEQVAERCRRIGGVFIVDEVTSGWRFGYPGAMAQLGFDPDIAVYAKAMSNGFPCAAVVGREGIMDAANASFISSTYWTDGVGPAAALACIRKMRRENTQQLVWQLGERLRQQLCALAAKYPTLKLKIEGQPCANQIVFDLGPNAQAAKQVLVRRMLSRGFLVWATWYLMGSHTEAEVTAAVEAMDPVLGEIAVLLEMGRLQAEAGVGGGVRAAMGQGIARLA